MGNIIKSFVAMSAALALTACNERISSEIIERGDVVVDGDDCTYAIREDIHQANGNLQNYFFVTIFCGNESIVCRGLSPESCAQELVDRRARDDDDEEGYSPPAGGGPPA